MFFYDVLTRVHKLAPIASQARHFPPRAGEADAKEKRNYSFYKCGHKRKKENKCEQTREKDFVEWYG